jgi:hypothetical protein
MTMGERRWEIVAWSEWEDPGRPRRSITLYLSGPEGERDRAVIDVDLLSLERARRSTACPPL